MQIDLIRHPRPALAEGICYGRTDLPLREDAALSAQCLQAVLPDDLAHIPVFSSPLQRCRLLAEQLHATPQFDARLQELDFGDWEMCPWTSLERAALDAWAADPLGFAAPRGESVAALRQRVAEFLGDLQRRHITRALLVTHAGVMKLCVAELLAWPSSEWLSLSFEFASLTRIADGKLVWHNRR